MDQSRRGGVAAPVALMIPASWAIAKRFWIQWRGRQKGLKTMTNDEIAAWRVLSGGHICQNRVNSCQHFSRSQSTTPFVTNCLCCAAQYGMAEHVESKVNCDGSPI